MFILQFRASSLRRIFQPGPFHVEVQQWQSQVQQGRPWELFVYASSLYPSCRLSISECSSGEGSEERITTFDCSVIFLPLKINPDITWHSTGRHKDSGGKYFPHLVWISLESSSSSQLYPHRKAWNWRDGDWLLYSTAVTALASTPALSFSFTSFCLLPSSQPWDQRQHWTKKAGGYQQTLSWILP